MQRQRCYRHLLCYVATRENKKCDDNIVAVTFFIALQQKKKKNATATMLVSPSSLQQNKRSSSWMKLNFTNLCTVLEASAMGANLGTRTQ